VRDPSRKLMETPTPSAGRIGGGDGGATGFRISETPDRDAYGVPLGAPGEGVAGPESRAAGGDGDLPSIRPEELQYFGKLLERGVDEAALAPEEAKERAIMKLLLRIKAGTPPQRKTALRQLADKARALPAPFPTALRGAARHYVPIPRLYVPFSNRAGARRTAPRKAAMSCAMLRCAAPVPEAPMG
jgi:hypothetical protein